MIVEHIKVKLKLMLVLVKQNFVKREVGEQWTDDDGTLWEQRKGYKVKLGKLSKLKN